MFIKKKAYQTTFNKNFLSSTIKRNKNYIIYNFFDVEKRLFDLKITTISKDTEFS